MSKKKLKLITGTYMFLVVISFAIYLYQVSDGSWEFEMDGQRENLSIFLGLLFIGLILSSINFAGIDGKGNKVTKSMIYGGLSVAAFFLIWRALMALV